MVGDLLELEDDDLSKVLETVGMTTIVAKNKLNKALAEARAMKKTP